MTNIILKLHFINKILIYWYFYRKCSFKKFVSYGSPFCRTNRLLLLDKYNSIIRCLWILCKNCKQQLFLFVFLFQADDFLKNLLLQKINSTATARWVNGITFIVSWNICNLNTSEQATLIRPSTSGWPIR